MPVQIVRSLIVDEIVTMKRPKASPVRIRIWAAQEKSTVVLFSQQLPDGLPPDNWSCPLANMVASGFLFHRKPLPTFYETSVVKYRTGVPVPRALRVTYSILGSELRPTLWKPSYAILEVPVFIRSLLVSTGTDELF